MRVNLGDRRVYVGGRLAYVRSGLGRIMSGDVGYTFDAFGSARLDRCLIAHLWLHLIGLTGKVAILSSNRRNLSADVAGLSHNVGALSDNVDG